METGNTPDLTEGQKILPLAIGMHINNGPTFNVITNTEVRAERSGENEIGLPRYDVPKADIVRALFIAIDEFIHDDDPTEEQYDLLREYTIETAQWLAWRLA